jgi:hypothetical protein
LELWIHTEANTDSLGDHGPIGNINAVLHWLYVPRHQQEENPTMLGESLKKKKRKKERKQTDNNTNKKSEEFHPPSGNINCYFDAMRFHKFLIKFCFSFRY